MYLNPAQYRQRYTSLTLATRLSALRVLSHGSDRAVTVLQDIMCCQLSAVVSSTKTRETEGGGGGKKVEEDNSIVKEQTSKATMNKKKKQKKKKYKGSGRRGRMEEGMERE